MTHAEKSPSPRHGVARAISKVRIGLAHPGRAMGKRRASSRQRPGGARRRVPGPSGPDRVTVDGAPSAGAHGHHVEQAARLGDHDMDEQGRDTVYRCFQGSDLPWLAPVGRLDKASEGLLLFSNDPAWAARITLLRPGRKRATTCRSARGGRGVDRDSGTGSGFDGRALRRPDPRQVCALFALRRQEFLARDHARRGPQPAHTPPARGLRLAVLRLVRIAIGSLGSVNFRRADGVR